MSFGIRVVPSLYQRVPLLIAGYAVLFMSLALGPVQGALTQVPSSLLDVARTLGDGGIRRMIRVTLRLCLPGVAAGFTLVFLTTMKELPTTLFLRPTGFDTLATGMWSHISSMSRSAAVPYAVAIVFMAALPTALFGALFGARGTRIRR